VHPPRKNSPLSALSSRRRHFPRRAFISSSACSAVKLSYRRPSLSGEAEAPARRAVWHRRRATGSGSTESATRTTFPLPDRGAEGNRHRPGSAGRYQPQSVHRNRAGRACRRAKWRQSVYLPRGPDRERPERFWRGPANSGGLGWAIGWMLVNCFWAE
jgi:hypothetical protein